MRLLRLFLPALSLLLAVPAQAHPQDGPHADVEIEIADDAVRFDMVINLVMVDEMTPVPRENPGEIHELEEPAVRDALVAYIAREHRVAIDGVEVAPIIERFSVIRPGLELLPLFPRTGMRGLTRVHLVLAYPVKAPPKTVAMRWGAYPPDYTLEPGPDGTRPPIALEARLRAEGRLTIIRFTRDEPEVIWHATGMTAEDRFAPVPDLAAAEEVTPRTIPALSLALGALLVLLVGVELIARKGRPRPMRLALYALVLIPSAWASAPVLRVPVSTGSVAEKLTPEQALEIFRPLHANIYRAFDYQTESEIYDALSRSVAGDLLDALYNQIYRSLIMQDQGGAVSSVQAVRLMDARIESLGTLDDGTPAFNVEARWQVDGVVNHFGHSHWRTNEYLARFGVARLAPGWRITSHEILESQRLDTDPFTDPTKNRPKGEL